MIKIYSDRAQSEIILSDAIKKISEDDKIKDSLNIEKSHTFYSAAISHSYYSIFYCAKALLLTKGITTSSPNIHRLTFDKFKETFVDTGILDAKLLLIYKKLVVRADELLGIFKAEKQKRGDFTYSTISQANKEPTEDSIKNAKIFYTNIIKVIDKEAQKKKN